MMYLPHSRKQVTSSMPIQPSVVANVSTLPATLLHHKTFSRLLEEGSLTRHSSSNTMDLNKSKIELMNCSGLRVSICIQCSHV